MQRQREIVVDNYEITSKTIDAAFKKAKMQNKSNLVLAQTFRMMNLNKLYQSSPSDSSIKQAIKAIVDSSFIPNTYEASFNTMPFDLSEIFPLNKLGNFGRVLQRKCRIVEKGLMQFEDEKQQPKLKELKNFVNTIERFGQPQNDSKIGWLSEQKKYPFRIILIDKNDGHKGLYFTNLQKAEQIRIALCQNYRLHSNFANIINSVSTILLKSTGDSFKKKLIARSNSLNKGSRFSRKVNIGATNMKESQLNRGDPNSSLISKLGLQSKIIKPQSPLKPKQNEDMLIIPGLLSTVVKSDVNLHFQNVNDGEMIDFLDLWNQKAQRQAEFNKQKKSSPVQTPNNSRIKVSEFEQNSNNLHISGYRRQPTLLKTQNQKSKNKSEFQKLLKSNIKEKNSQFKQKDSYIKQISRDNSESPSIEFYTIEFLTLNSLFFKPIVTVELIKNNKTQQSILFNTIIKRKDPYLCYELIKNSDDQSLVIYGNLNQYQIVVSVIDFLANEQVVNDRLTLKNRIIRDKVCLVCDGKLVQLQLQVKKQLMKSNKVEKSYEEEVVNLQVKIPNLSQEIKQKINQYWQNQSQAQGYYNQTNLTIYRILSQIEIIPLTWWKDISEDQFELLQVVYTASKILGFKMIRSFPHIINVFVRMFPNLEEMIEKLLSFVLTFLKVYYFPQFLNRLQKFHRLLGLDEDCQFISKINLQIMVIERIVEMQCPMLVNKLNRKNLSFGYLMMQYIYEAFSRNFTVNQLSELWNYLYQDLQFLQLNMVMIAIALIKFYEEDLMRAKRLNQFACILQTKKINRLQFIISQIESNKQKYFGETRGFLDQIKRIFNSKPLEPVLYQFYKRQTSKLDERKKNKILEKKTNLRKVNKQIDIQFPQYPKKHYTLHLYFIKLPQIGGSITIKCNDVDYECLNHEKTRYFIISQVSNKVTVSFLDVKSNEYSCSLIFTQGIHQQSCYLTSAKNSISHKITYLAGLLTDSQIQIFKKGRKFDQFISPFVKKNDVLEEMNRPLQETLFLRKYDNNSSKDDLVKKIKGLFCSGNKVFNQIEFYIEQIQTSNLTIQQKIFHVRDLARIFSEQFFLCQNQTLEKHLIRYFLESSGYEINQRQFECFYNDSLQYEFDGPKILKCRFLPNHHSIRQIKLQLQVSNYFINKSNNYLYPDIIIDELMQVVKSSINQQLGNLHEGQLKLSYSSGGQVFLKCWQLKLKNKNKQMYYEEFKQDTSQQIQQAQIGEPELLMTEVLPSFAKISTILDYVNTNRNLDLKTKYQDKERKKLAQSINLLKQCQTKFNKVILMRYMMYPQKLRLPFFNYYYQLTHDLSTPVIKTIFLNNLKTDLKTLCLFRGQLKYGQNSKIQSFAYSSDLGLYGNLRLMSNDAKGWFFFGSEKDDHGKQKHEAKVFFNYGYGIFRWENCQVLGVTKKVKQSKILKSGNSQRQEPKTTYLIVIRNQERFVKEYELQISSQTLSKIEQLTQSGPRNTKREPFAFEENQEEQQSGLKYLSKFIK